MKCSLDLIERRNSDLWYKFEPLQTFSYKTPEQLCGTGRCDDLIAYLESISTGPLG